MKVKDGVFRTRIERWGSDGAVIDSVSFDDIRFDIPPERVAHQLQQSDDMKFVPEQTNLVRLAGVGAYSLGKWANNQGKPGYVDPEFFRLEYRNLAFRDFQIYDGPRHLMTAESGLECQIEVSTKILPHFSVRGLETSGLPPNTRVKREGDVM